MADMTDIYKVLNEAHLDTQIRLERASAQIEALAKIANSNTTRLEAVNIKLDEYNEFLTQTKTVFSIIKWFITPSMALMLIIQISTWLAKTQIL